MNRATAQTFKSLEHHQICRVEVADDTVELGVPESEGWRLAIAPALDETAQPTLIARWEPGLRASHGCRRALWRAIARHTRRGSLHTEKTRFERSPREQQPLDHSTRRKRFRTFPAQTRGEAPMATFIEGGIVPCRRRR
jgi:hypothetical protein